MPISPLFALFAIAHPVLIEIGPIEIRPIVGEFRYDPVDLIRTGKPVVGAVTLSADRYAYRYYFSSAGNRQEFLAHPDLYEIQLGGGCGKMGSLSGRGNPNRYAVYEGKIYTFASDGCRATFLANAPKLIEKDDPKPAGTRQEAREGRKLFQKAIAWAGGAKALAGLKAFQFHFAEKVKQGNTEYDHRQSIAVEFPNRILRADRWNASSYSDLKNGAEGYFLNSSGPATVMHPVQVRALQRVRNHLLPVILKSHSGRDFVALARGKAAGGLQRVEVHFDGSWAALEIDPADGRIASIEFIARHAAHGVERHDYSDFAEFEGIKFPTAWKVSFEGKEIGRQGPQGITYQLNLEGIRFDLPK